MASVASRVAVMSRLGRAMAEPTRARILCALLEGPEYTETLAQQLALTRSNVSNHLSWLRGCGIAAAVREGRWTRYEIADPGLTKALKSLVEVALGLDDEGGGEPAESARDL